MTYPKNKILLGLTFLYAISIGTLYALYVDEWVYLSTGFIFALIIGVIALHRGMEAPSKSTSDTPALTEIVRQNRITKELEMARRVQEGLLSVTTPEIPGLHIARRCEPATRIGGDFYSFFDKNVLSLTPSQKQTGIVEFMDQDDTHLGVIMGDVAGHGVSSALIMALASGLINEIGKQGSSTSQTLEKANNDLVRYIENSEITHVTAFYGILNTERMTLQFSRAGHPPALLARANQPILELSSTGVFLGMFTEKKYEEKEIALHHGDRIILYTDGITETRSSSGEFYGVQRLMECISTHQTASIEDTLDAVFNDVSIFSNHQSASDDRTLAIIELE